MQIDEQTYNDLLAYLAKRPWFEVNKLIQALAQASRPAIDYPKELEEKRNG